MSQTAVTDATDSNGYLQRILRARVYEVAIESPLDPAPNLSVRLGNRVLLKREDLQPVFSFKLRGAYNKMVGLSQAELERGVIAASAGNHAQGVAMAAQRLRCRAVIVMPVTTPEVKVKAVAARGAEVVLHGDSYDDACGEAQRLGAEAGLSFIHPFDDPDVIAGQGTIALEVLRQCSTPPDAIYVAVGGGGLIGGIATAVRRLKPSVRIVGVQTERFPAMYDAIKGTRHTQGAGTIAEGIAVGQPGRITEAIVRARVDDLMLVDEGDIEQAILMLLEIEKTLVEGAGAAGLAALLREPARFAGRKVGLVLCGGNIDPLLLAAIIQRGMVRAGRLARIRVGARDLPGVLARITAVVAEAGANIDEVHHQRAFSTLSAQNVEVELVLQTRNRAHIDDVLARLTAAGFEAAAY